MMREGSLPAGLAQPDPSTSARRWSGTALQSLVLVVLLAAMAFAGISFWFCLPLALLALWLPHLRLSLIHISEPTRPY